MRFLVFDFIMPLTDKFPVGPKVHSTSTDECVGTIINRAGASYFAALSFRPGRPWLSPALIINIIKTDVLS